ncbi:hypothetical protein ACLMJK_008819 [Lecanora helva]
MEGFTAIVSAAQAISYIASVTKGLNEVRVALKHGPDFLRNEQASVSHLKEIIDQITSAEEASVDSRLCLLLQSISCTVEKLLTLIEYQNKRSQLVLIFVIRRTEIKESLASLERKKNTLILYLTAHNSAAIDSLRADTPTHSTKNATMPVLSKVLHVVVAGIVWFLIPGQVQSFEARGSSKNKAEPQHHRKAASPLQEATPKVARNRQEHDIPQKPTQESSRRSMSPSLDQSDQSSQQIIRRTKFDSRKDCRSLKSFDPHSAPPQQGSSHADRAETQPNLSLQQSKKNNIGGALSGLCKNAKNKVKGRSKMIIFAPADHCMNVTNEENTTEGRAVLYVGLDQSRLPPGVFK